MDVIGMIRETLGFSRWPLAFAVLMVAGLSAWSIGQLARSGAAPDPRTKASVDGVLFWSGFAAVTGVLGSLVGIITTLQRIERAGEVTSVLVGAGWKVALVNSTIGFAILAGGGVSWFLLQTRWRFVEARGGHG